MARSFLPRPKPWLTPRQWRPNPLAPSGGRALQGREHGRLCSRHGRGRFQDRIQAVYSRRARFHQRSMTCLVGRGSGRKEDKTCPPIHGHRPAHASGEPTWSRNNTTGVSQHYCLNWLVEKGISCRRTNRSQRQTFRQFPRSWLQARPYDQRKTIVTTVYQALKAGGYDNIQELKDNFSSAAQDLRGHRTAGAGGQIHRPGRRQGHHRHADPIHDRQFLLSHPPPRPSCSLRPNQQTQQNPTFPKQKV